MRRTARLLLAVLLAAPAACGRGGDTTASAGAGASPPTAPSPDTPVGTDVPSGAPPGELRPARVTVVAGAVDLRPRPFDWAEPVGDRQLAVRFWGGVAPCSVVGRVDVDETPQRVTVTVFGGRDPAPGRVACIELAVYQEVVVDLAAPVAGRVVVDGAA